jgi:hypothetical protein
VLVTKKGPVDLMSYIPIEAEEIEDLMQKSQVSGNGKSVNSKVPVKARQAAQLAR